MIRATIKKPKRFLSNLPLIDHQIENTIVDGQPTLTTLIGEAPKTPQELIEGRESTRRLNAVLDNLDDEQKELTDRIFDAILQIHHYRDQEQLISFVVQSLNYEVSAQQVRDMFSDIRAKIENRSAYID